MRGAKEGCILAAALILRILMGVLMASNWILFAAVQQCRRNAVVGAKALRVANEVSRLAAGPILRILMAEIRASYRL